MEDKQSGEQQHRSRTKPPAAAPASSHSTKRKTPAVGGHLFHSNLVRFCEALRQQFQTSFVFVGGCASMFCLPPAYDDAVNYVIETFRHMGITCNNAPETHQLPVCDDQYHFHPDVEPLLLAMWEKAVIELARPCNQTNVLPRSVANRWTRRHRFCSSNSLAASAAATVQFQNGRALSCRALSRWADTGERVFL